MAEPPQLDGSPHLDSSLYSLTPDELAFYQRRIGIADETELKEHIIDVQTRAYKHPVRVGMNSWFNQVFPYPCIRRFSFTKLWIQRHPAYKHALEYVQKHPDAIYLELGCCFGNVPRKAVLDGYPPQNIIATDLHQEFWDLGYELFKDNPSTFPASFIPGDILSPEVLDPSAEKLNKKPVLSELKSLTELLGRVSIIHASSFFHLFSEGGAEDQMKVARSCVSLLTGLPGTTIFGGHIAAPKPGLYQRPRSDNAMFCHSPESWEEMWKEALKSTGRDTEVRVWTKMTEMSDDPLFSGGRGYMVWGVELA
ncbi:hypothetical protein FRC07_009470 [Ceratobasidium sp. 392]|nr:hypothetical protein FRC07_009470 [Ceratobasidium sp. 392]